MKVKDFIIMFRYGTEIMIEDVAFVTWSGKARDLPSCYSDYEVFEAVSLEKDVIVVRIDK